MGRKKKSNNNLETGVKKHAAKLSRMETDVKQSTTCPKDEKKCNIDEDMEDEEIQLIDDTPCKTDIEITSTDVEYEENQEDGNIKDDGYDSDFEKMAGDLPMFSSDECILGF